MAAESPAVAESIAETAETAETAAHEQEPAVEAVETGRVEGVEEAQAESAPDPDNPISAPPPEKSRRGGFLIFGVLIVAVAGAVAWIASPGHRPGDGSLKSRVIALLPESAQRALHAVPAPGSNQPTATAPAAETADAGKPAAPVEKSAADTSSDAARPAEAPNADTAVPASGPETAKSDPAKPEPAIVAPSGPKLSEQQAGGAAISGGPVAPIGADSKPGGDSSAKVDALQNKVDGLQTKLDAALGRIDALQSKLDLAQGRIELAQSKSDAAATAGAVAQAAQSLETLTQRLAAIEQKLEQPKVDARATQARENNAPSGREFAASRAVVAQATSEALRAGAPLADNLAALKGLGVSDEKTADLNAYAKTGAPTVAQLTQQWRGLRDKVLALDGPSAGASFTDKLLAKARGVFRITWAGQGAQNSIGGTVARIDAALQKSDLPGAVAACEDFPAVAKNLVADWQVAASARLKADAAARTLLSESISAIGRSSSP